METLLLIASLLQAPQTGPVIRTTTHLVQVNVVVHDKKGNPVTDLTKDDFVLTDKGQQQQIRFFSMETEKRDAPPQPPIPRAEGVYSNRLASPDPARPEPNLTVVLLDGLNTGFTDQHYMRKAALKVLSNTHAGDPVALYTLNNGLRVVHDFTSQPAELLAAMSQYQAGNSRDLAGSTPNTDILTPTMSGVGHAQADAVLNAMTKNLEEATQLFFVRERVRVTVAAFETIAFHLQGMPGRKNLIWISGSFPFSFGLNADSGAGNNYDDFADQIQRVVREFNRAGIVIYPVDARGLTGMFANYPTYSASSQGPGPGVNRLDTSTRNNITSTQATMQFLASKTGGKAFMESNDLERAIQMAMDDARTTYVLSFSPTHNQWNGEFREIKVQVRRPGLEVRYRAGYLAMADPSTDVKERQRAIVAAGNIPLLSTGLTLNAWVGPETGGANLFDNELQLEFTMDANEIAFNPNDKGEWTATLDFLILVREANGRAIETISRTMRKALSEESYQAIRKNGLQLSFKVPRAYVSTRMRLIARDANTGLVGSVDIPVN